MLAESSILWFLAPFVLPEAMRWLTATHTQRWHAHRHTAGTGGLMTSSLEHGGSCKAGNGRESRNLLRDQGRRRDRGRVNTTDKISPASSRRACVDAADRILAQALTWPTARSRGTTALGLHPRFRSASSVAPISAITAPRSPMFFARERGPNRMVFLFVTRGWVEYDHPWLLQWRPFGAPDQRHASRTSLPLSGFPRESGRNRFRGLHRTTLGPSPPDGPFDVAQAGPGRGVELSSRSGLADPSLRAPTSRGRR